MKSIICLSILLCLASSVLAFPHGRATLRPVVRPTSSISNIKFAAANPNYYNRSEGGGVVADSVTSLIADDVRLFLCDEVVSFFISFDVNPSLPSDVSLTVQFDVNLEGQTTGQPGAGYVEFIHAVLSEGDPYLQRAYGNTHTITYYQTKYGTPLVSTSGFKPYIVGSVEMSGLVAGERIVIRVDARLGCDMNADPTGNIQASLDRGVIIAPAAYVSGNNGEITAAMTVPFKPDGIVARTLASLSTPVPTPSPGPVTTPAPTPATLASNQCYCSLKFVVVPDSSICMDYKGMDGDAMYCQLRPCKDSYKNVCDPNGTSICTKSIITRQVLRFLSFRDEPAQEAFCEYKTVTSEILGNVTTTI